MPIMPDSIDLLIQQKRMMYITSLLNETMPSSMLTNELRQAMDLDHQEAFGLVHILFDNHLQDIIEGKETSDAADWKAELHDNLLEVFQSDMILSSCILNLAPYTRTLVYSFHPKDLDQLQPHISSWFKATNNYLIANENSQMIAFANPKVVELKHIGKLYKELRQLQEYKYTIGMGNLTFFDDFRFNDPYAITDYKFIQRFEFLLKEEAYEMLEPIVSELESYIHHHGINDSKIVYIYKELMSITIRHLYTQETEHLKIIEALNHAINNFSNQFNDLKEVNNYIRHLLASLMNTNTDHSPIHPHIKKILKSIDDAYDKDLTLDAISEYLNLSDAYLSRLFKEQMGITYKQYLTKYRLNKIKDLLVTSNKSITTIASLTGYQSANQLTRIFKKYEQMTPREFRQISKSI